MSENESHRAAAEARRAVTGSSAPLSRHDVALRRYLGAVHFASLQDTGLQDTSLQDTDSWPVSAPAAATSVPVPELSVVAPIEGTPDRAAVAPRTDLVIAGVDHSPHAYRAAVWAAAEAVHRHAALRLVYAYSLPIAGYAGYSMAPHDLGNILRAEGAKLLRSIAGEIRVAHPDLEVQTRLFQGDAVVALRRESARARLTVVGSLGSGRVSGVLLGSIAMAITAHGTAPVAIVPAEGPGWATSGAVVVGADGSSTSEAALRFAFEEAAVRGTGLVAVHTWNPPRPALVDVTSQQITVLDESERLMLSEELAGWRDKYPDVPVVQEVVRGRATPVLLSFARSAQLLVVGSRGRGGFAGMLLGSTSQSLISHAHCPVVVVRPNSLD